MRDRDCGMTSSFSHRDNVICDTVRTMICMQQRIRRGRIGGGKQEICFFCAPIFRVFRFLLFHVSVTLKNEEIVMNGTVYAGREEKAVK